MFKINYIFICTFLLMSCSTQIVANDNIYKLDNQEIYFKNYGESNNPEILLVHGLMGSSTSFDEIVAYLEKDFYLTVIDLPGHGKSNLTIDFNIQELTLTLNSFIESNFENATNLVGYSLGGTITNNLLSVKSNKINKVILIDPWFSNNTTIDSAAFKLLGFIEKREKNGWLDIDDAQNYAIGMNPNLNLNQNESIGKNRFEYDIKVWDSSIQKGTLIKNEQYKFDNPALLIKPESSLVRESQIRKLENNFSNFSIDEIDDSTHMIIFEKPFEISEKIVQFIK